MNNIILIIDDEEINRDILGSMLEEEYRILEAENGLEALELLHQHCNEIGAVLLDLLMPRMNGYDLLEKMNELGYINQLPVLIISSESSLDSEKKCFDLGAFDFIHKPFDRTLVRRRVDNAAQLYIYRNKLEQKVKEQTAALEKQNKLLDIQAKKLMASNARITDILGTVVEYRNMESGEHIQRVKSYTEILAREVKDTLPAYGLTDEFISKITAASALHDVGKISIPDGILLKPGRLTDEEYGIMKTHTIKGCEILDHLKSEWDRDYATLSYDICRYHHERYDGRGYPEGLKGDDIPLAAQLVGVADVYDALVNERCYKKAFTPEKAYEMIQNGECGAFSPGILQCLTGVKEQFAELALSKGEKWKDQVGHE